MFGLSKENLTGMLGAILFGSAAKSKEPRNSTVNEIISSKDFKVKVGLPKGVRVVCSSWYCMCDPYRMRVETVERRKY